VKSLRKSVFALFFLSGFCGLLYQVVWIRLAFAHFGIITPVLSVVVSVFMLGLAIGSWASGRLAAGLSDTGGSAIYYYAATEAFIGLGAFIVPALFHFGSRLLLPSGELNSVFYLAMSAAVLGLSILPWCILMGGTFPLMMGFLKDRAAGQESSFSFLYLANVIGAMCGTILTADVLVECLGFKRTLAVAGFTNFLIAFASVRLARKHPGWTKPRAAAEPAAPLAAARHAWPWANLILFTTGFTAMALEVIWVRDFTSIVGTTVYAFALIVAVYLAATWVGSAVYRRQLARGRTWGAAPLINALVVSVFLPLVMNDPRLGWGHAGVIISIIPFSLLLGYLTPGLVDAVSQGDPHRAGTAYAVNILGCILGPLFASYLFLPFWGVKISMIAMALPYIALSLMVKAPARDRWRVVMVPAGLALLLLSVFVSRSHEERYPDGVVRRDSTATVISVGSGMNRRLIVNGVGITELTTITKVMAHFPILMLRHPPTSALDICFGMGTTFRSLLTWDGLKVTAVELVPSVKQAFGYYHANAAEVMANPRGQVVIDDGRRFLNRTRESFDLITIDPPPPIEAAGSSLLYAREFYDVIKRRLKPDGILQQWYPGGPGVEAQSITRSLTEAFPYVRVFVSSKSWGIHYFASMQPIHVPTLNECLTRLPPAAEADLLEWEHGVTPRAFWSALLAREMPVQELMTDHPVIALTDDRPYNEYYLLRRSWRHYQPLLRRMFPWLT
jgi:spermidine synthase